MKTYKLLTEPRSSSIFTRHAIHHHSSNTPTYTEKLRFKTCTSTSSRYQERKATFARSPPLREKTNIMPLHEKKAICSVELQPAVIASTARARQCTFTIIIALARAPIPPGRYSDQSSLSCWCERSINWYTRWCTRTYIWWNAVISRERSRAEAAKFCI